MSRAVYSTATVKISDTDFSVEDTLEVSDFTVNIVNNTTPDWEYFGADWVVNYPTTAAWSMSWNSILDDTLGIDLDGIVGAQCTVEVDTETGRKYSGTGTVSADISVSRGDYGKVAWSVKGSGTLTEAAGDA